MIARNDLAKKIASRVKYGASCNIYFEDFLFHLIKGRRNRRVANAVREIGKIDSVFCFKEFRKAVVELKEKHINNGAMFEIAGVGSESRYYGHLKALADYAGVPYARDLALLFPYIEHGIRFNEDLAPVISDRSTHCVVSQGGYLREKLDTALPGIPKYEIGPYIHYASPAYAQEEIDRLRLKYGKTLLVFPAHSIESSERKPEGADIISLIERIAGKGFENVIVCFYWNDVDSSLVDRANAAGYVTVSAGLRGDVNFISRLKSLILLSDAVLGDSLGTNIGYSLYLGRPFRIMDNTHDVSAPMLGLPCESSLCLARTLFSDFASLEDKRVESFFNRFWGGARCIKSSQEIRYIFDLSRECLEMTKGNSSYIAEAYSKIMSELNAGSNKEKREVLERALYRW